MAFIGSRRTPLCEDQHPRGCCSEAPAQLGVLLLQLPPGLYVEPVPLRGEALVVSDNADIHGTIAYLIAHLLQHE